MPRKGKGKGKGRKPRGKRGWLWLLLKLAIVFAVLIAIYGVYLDQKIRSRIDGKVWQLPAAVYGRMVNLEPDMTISKNEMVKLLEATQYRQVSKMTRPGEFTVQANSIEMIRRPFDFPDSKEGQVRARLTFDGDHLATIVNMENNRQFGFFRLDPRLITMISRQTVSNVCLCRAVVSLICWWILCWRQKTAISTSMMGSASTQLGVRCWQT